MKPINKNNTKSISISPLKKMFKYEYDRAKKEGLSSIAYEKINYLKEIPKLYKTWKTNKGYKPISINVYCTYKCNLRCKICGIGNGAMPKSLYKNEITTQRYFSFFEEAGKLGAVKLHFTGGEPFLRSDILDLVKHAKKHIPFVNMTTNGTLITHDSAEQLVKNGLDAIKISIDGNELSHDIIRGLKGSWKKSIDGIKYINDAKKKLNQNLMIGVNCIVNAINYRNADELIDKLHEIGGVSLVQFSPLFNYKELNNGGDIRLPLTENEAKFFVEKVIPKINKKAKEYGITIQSSPAWGYVNEENLLEKYRINYCFLPWTWLILSPQGNIFPCGGTQYDNFYGEDPEAREQYIMGNLNTSTLSEIWNNDKFLNFRKKCNPLKHDICNFCCHIRSVKSTIDKLNKLPFVNLLPDNSQSFIAYLLSVEPSIISMFHKNIAFMAKKDI